MPKFGTDGRLHLHEDEPARAGLTTASLIGLVFANNGTTHLAYDLPMSRLLLNLRHVPDDEIDEVRAMLDDAGIAYYQTRPSRWGISSGGIWVSDDNDAARAKALMADCQATRQKRARAEHQAALRDGTAETFRDVLRRQPAQVALIAVAIVLLLALVALPAIMLRQ